MRSMLHHRELENLKGRYENNLESVLAVQFVCYTLEELVWFPIQAELPVYFMRHIFACFIVKLAMTMFLNV